MFFNSTLFKNYTALLRNGRRQKMFLFVFLLIGARVDVICSMEIQTNNASDSSSCDGKNTYDPKEYFQRSDCFTDLCSNSLLKILETYIFCNDWSTPKQPQMIAQNVADYLLKLAVFLTGNLSVVDSEAKKSWSYTSIFLISEYGYLNKKLMQSWNPVVFDFDNSVSYELPPTQLENDKTPFQITVFNTNIVKAGDNAIFKIDRSALRQTLQKLGDPDILPENGVEYLLNSKIIFISLYRIEKINTEFSSMKFTLVDSKTMINHRCVKLVDGLGTGSWTDGGCYLSYTDTTTVKCRCDVIEGTFAIVSQKIVMISTDEKIKRDIITDGLSIVCYIGIGTSLLSILYPYAMRCTNFSGMILIYRYCDFIHAMEFVLILVGIQLSEDAESSNSISTIINFLHHSVMTWFVCEGLYLIHGITPLYDEKIGASFFYSTLAFGIPAALAASVAGYDYSYKGVTQFLWPYPSSTVDIGYFILPTIIIMIIIVITNVILIYDLSCWIGSHEDYLYVRSKVFVIRSIGFTLVFPITHVFGIISMKLGETGSYPYLFIGFVAIQVIQMFYFHVINNFEVRAFQKLKEEVENATEEKDVGNFRDKEQVSFRSKIPDSNFLLREVYDEEEEPKRSDTPSSTGSQTYLFSKGSTKKISL
ncbi:adhesion G protein-coupled receptor B1 [Hydra vulgaris]|uniref:Adhesion G protein-coupled receptor B1 n=1 Tax=Hydra vulgaris TaxID=6087 RepID=A0ABM4BBX7_HYDVU